MGKLNGDVYYTNVYPYDAVAGIATGGELGGGSSGPTATAASPSATSSKGAASALARPAALLCAGALGLVAAALL